jgi:hypothetical protein
MTRRHRTTACSRTESRKGDLRSRALWAGASALYGVREHPGEDIAQILIDG